MRSDIEGKPDLAWTLARNLVAVGYQDLTRQVVEATKKSILDTLGVILAAGTLCPGLKGIVELVREGGGREDSSVLGFGFKVPAWMAAFANGAMAHALDYEEVSTPLGHPSASTIPSGIAVAERLGTVTGRQFITAIALGNDLFCRMVNSFPPDTLWHKVTVAGFFASAATSGKLLQLNEEQMVDALGLAFAQASGTMELRFGVGSDIGGFRDAFSNKGGVLAALLAQRGVHGVRSCLEGKAGLYNVYFGGKYDREVLTADLGKVFHGAVAYKPWPSCGGTHSHLEAALSLAGEHDIHPEDVARVTVFVGDTTMNLCQPLEARRRPATTMDAKYSIPFTTAVAMVRRNVTLKDFSEEGLKDPAVLEFAAKVSPKFDEAYQPGQGRRPAKLEIVMKDGETYSKSVELPYYYREPVAMAGIVNKFRDCISYATKPLSGDDVDKLIDGIRNLDSEADVFRIIRLLA